MSDAEGCAQFVLISFMVLVGFFFGIWVGGAIRRNSERAIAIKAGVGWYESDPATGTTTFYYGRR